MINFILENFDTIFKNKTSLETLDKVILDLAIKGKLVEQRESDEPASELLKRIKAEKQRLIDEKIIKKEKPLPPIEEEEIPFDIPSSWEWVRLGKVITLKGGKRVANGYKLLETPTPYIYIRITDMKNYSIKDNDLRYIDEKMYQKIKQYIITKDDLYITIAGTIGYVGEVPEKFDNMNLTENAGRIIPYFVNKSFLKYLLNSEICQKQFNEMVNKMAQPKLALTRIQETIIPLPPIEEQKRIVSKVEKLQSIIKDLKEIYIKNQNNRENLKKSLLFEIESQSSDKDLLKSLETVFANFDKIIKTKEDIKDIRNLILSLAIKGKLVEQNQDDEKASELLKRIKAEKQRLIDKKVIKKEKPLPPIEDEEIPFDIPSSWEWVRLKDMLNIYSGLSFNKKNLDIVEEKMISVFRGGNITERGYIFREDDVKIAPIFVKKEELYLKKNQLITPAVTSKEQLGKMALIEKDYSDVVAGGFVLNLVPFFNDENHSKYLLYILSSQTMKNRYVGIANKSGQAFYNLSREKLGNLLIPLPSIEEQKRIVSKVESLMKICDLLEEKIILNEKISDKILGSLTK